MFCKIGVTKRKVTERIKEIQTSCPLPIIGYYEISNLSKGDAYHIENKIKSHLSHHLINGEWYNEFKGISKSVKFLLAEIGLDYKGCFHNILGNKFEDLSVRIINNIKKHIRDNDIESLSGLLSNINNNKKDYSDNKFFMYSKEVVLEHTKNAINTVLRKLEKNQIKIPDTVFKIIDFDKNSTDDLYTQALIKYKKTRKYSFNMLSHNEKTMAENEILKAILKDIENGVRGNI